MAEGILQRITEQNKEDLIRKAYKEYFPLVRKYVCSNKGDVDDAKDVFQEALIKVISTPEKFGNPDYNEKAMILAIARNKWIDKVRRANNFSRKTDQIIEFERANYSTSDALFQSEKNKKIEEVFSSLGERCKELLTNTFFYNYSMKEIAELMNFSSEDSAKTQHYKCKQKLIDLYKNDKSLKEILISNG